MTVCLRAGWTGHVRETTECAKIWLANGVMEENGRSRLEALLNPEKRPIAPFPTNEEEPTVQW